MNSFNAFKKTQNTTENERVRAKGGFERILCIEVEFSVLQMMLKKIRQPEFLVMRKEFSIKTITRISSVWLKWVE